MALPDQGVKSVDIFCPGFSADCLETLEEIAVENKHYFVDAGGSNYNYIPALNASPEHIATFANLIEQSIADWIEDLTAIDEEQQATERREQQENLEKVKKGMSALPY